MCAVAKREQTRWHSLAATLNSRRYKAGGTAEAPGGSGMKVLASDDADEAPNTSPARATRRASGAMAQTVTPARPCCGPTGYCGMEAALQCAFTVHL